MIGGTILYDYWIVKLNATGEIEWQNTIGGTGNDQCNSISLTNDGGFIVGGTSSSPISGDKTESVSGGSDFWVVKLYSSGEIQWQSTLGGNGIDNLNSILQTSDGGFILGGSSNSGISGDKAEPVVGGGFTFNDYWVIKLDIDGNIEWQNTIGGNNFDHLKCIIQTVSNGYFLAGYSTSGLSADKSEISMPGGDFGYDFWVLQLDNSGNILWQNTIGGDGDDYLVTAVQSDDAGFLLGGYSNSSYSGDKTEYNDNVDYWIIKIDSAGGILWQNTMTGTVYKDYLTSINITQDNGYFIAGYSRSGMSDDKTEIVVGGGGTYYDYWVMRLTPDTCTVAPYYNDFDFDGEGSGPITGNACDLPAGHYSFGNADCMDNRSAVFPGAFEACDGLDNDCDGEIDEDILACDPGPAMEWQNTIGGSQDDYLRSIELTTDGGYISCGWTLSGISGDKTENSMGSFDFWVIKLDAGGNILWQNTIGGNAYDSPASIQQTNDGGYILGGTSSSGISGDKTENVVGLLGFEDYWILKLNAFGEIEWQNTIGGNSGDNLSWIEQTADGGFIVGGNSSSSISGDKTEGNFGSSDYWVIKLDAVGNIIWQNTIGGSGTDNLTSIKQTNDGGYIISGDSRSGISGDKTEGVIGGGTIFADYWVIKLNSAGNIEWQNTIGGTGSDFMRSIIQTSDGGYFVGGSSFSVNSGDKTEDAIGAEDYWILLLDSAGNVTGQNTIGGFSSEIVCSVQQTSDGGFLLGGQSRSEINGDKTENVIGGNSFDYWIVKLDETGILEWQNTIGGTLDDVLSTAIQTGDGGFILGGTSHSDPPEDKEENSQGFYDFWIIKLFPECTPADEICNSVDDNCNGLTDEGISETISIESLGPVSFCKGDSVVLVATFTGETVQWKRNGIDISGATSPAFTATMKGNYTCATTSNCDTTVSDFIYVNIYNPPASLITALGATTFCAGGSVLLNANIGFGLSYQWYKAATAIPGAVASTYLAATAGNYRCIVTNVLTGCPKTSNKISVLITCREEGIAENNFEVSVFPNPADNELNVLISSIPATISISDISGKIMLKQHCETVENKLFIGDLAVGMYLVQILYKDEIRTEKLIIE